MKRILSFSIVALLSLSCLLIVAPSVEATEDDSVYLNGSSMQYEIVEGEVPITATVGSNITIYFPLDATNEASNAIIGRYANIAPGKAFNVYITNLDDNGYLTLYNDYGSDSLAAVLRSNDYDLIGLKAGRLTQSDSLLVSFYQDEFIGGDDNTGLGDNYCYRYFSIQATGSGADNIMRRAGTYYGAMCYRIEFSDIPVIEESAGTESSVDE